MFATSRRQADGAEDDRRTSGLGWPIVAGHPASDFDFSAELDDLIGGDSEKLGRMRRNARQPRIETLAPSCHSRALGRFDIEPPDKERHLAGVKIEPRNVRTAKLAEHWASAQSRNEFRSARSLGRADVREPDLHVPPGGWSR